MKLDRPGMCRCGHSDYWHGKRGCMFITPRGAALYCYCKKRGERPAKGREKKRNV